ncbi:MAG: 50S ribosomal protein L13 [Candidatus Omnitrophica bacterium]|nr:50S ribosomal protein L13 [Candidatus Omnitrophota bacterium]
MQKTTKFFNNVQRNWYLVDAKDKILGRLSRNIARILQGKHKPCYSPNFLCGDYVIVINSRYIKLTGKKSEEKIYDKYSGYPDGRREMTFRELSRKNPSKILYFAIKGMLPKTRLGKRMLRMLKIYPDDKHSHQAQKPQKIEL